MHPIVPIGLPPIVIFFGPLKDALCGTKVEDDEDVIHAVNEQDKAWYGQDIHALVSI